MVRKQAPMPQQGLMREGQVVDIGLNLALSAAANGLPMADSLIYATALAHQIGRAHV